MLWPVILDSGSRPGGARSKASGMPWQSASTWRFVPTLLNRSANAPRTACPYGQIRPRRGAPARSRQPLYGSLLAVVNRRMPVPEGPPPRPATPAAARSSLGERLLQWQLPNPPARCSEHRVRQRRSGGGGAGLAHPAGFLEIPHEIHLDPWRLVHAHHSIIVEVRLL